MRSRPADAGRGDAEIDPLTQPIFVVAPARAGARLVADALGGARACWEPKAAALPAPVPELGSPRRLTAVDCTASVRHRLRASLQVQFARDDRSGGQHPAAPRLLHASPRNALLIPFLDAAFPDATFVYVHRRPVDALTESLVMWRAGKAVTYPELPGWTGPAWSFLLVPGWQELIGLPLAEIVTEQWVRTMRLLTDDLEQLAPDRWCVVAHDRLVPDPRAETDRVARYLGLEPPTTASPRPARIAFPDASLRAARAELEPYLERTSELAGRAADWVAQPAR